MATLVTFHAHPDDEAIATGGIMAKAAAAGHRVILVVATGGELGEVAEGVLAPGETLAERRARETAESAQLLGASRVEFLGYHDSGMIGEPTNEDPACFWKADVDEAAERLAKLLFEETADILTAYDPNGAYGHPDHIQVHRVGVRAAELAGTRKVYEATMDRDRIRRLMRAARDRGDPVGDPEEFTIGVPGELITTRVDVTEWIDVKRAAMAAHGSQISEASFFLAMPRERFVEAFGVEDFILRGAPPGTRETDLFEGL